jgi:GT2 family glycosyltransferase
MHRTPDAAVVCGRRRERAPSASIYNRLCDLEWDTPVGETDSCGGDFLARADAIASVGGFTDELIAGEEPELCHRLRGAGWTIYRIAREMTLHDAAMYRFSQWWQRNRRSGHASAEALHRRGSDEPRLWRTVLSNIFWANPVAWPLWPLMWWRIARRSGRLYATFILLGKIPHCQGQILYWAISLSSSRSSVIIEYK